MSNKKLRKIIKKSNKELVEQLRNELLRITITGTSKAIKQSLRKEKILENNAENLITDYTQVASKMIGDLYEKMSGTSSEGESYTFSVGQEAALLKKVQNKLINEKPISIYDTKAVYKIYKRFFPQEAEKIQI